MRDTNTLINDIKSWLATQYENPKTLGGYHRECNTVVRKLVQLIGCDASAPLTNEQLEIAMKQLNETFPSIRCYYGLHHLTAYLQAQGCHSERCLLLQKTKAIWSVKFHLEREEQSKKDLPITLQEAQQQLNKVEVESLDQSQ